MKNQLQQLRSILLVAGWLISTGFLSHGLSAQNPENPFGSNQSDALSLRGDIYFLADGTSSLPDFSQLRPVGAIFTKVLDIPGRPFTSGFPGITSRFEWFAIRYTGTFRVNTAGEYKFRLVSDDGSKLFINGRQIINNDGIHPAKSAGGSIYLGAGQHQIEVQYFQGPRDYIALQLFWTPPGGIETTAAPEYVPSNTPATTPAPSPNTGVVSINCGCNPALNLSGVWTCDDGGTYYLRQIGCTVWWFGELSPTNPSWANVAQGTLYDNILIMEFADVPKGRASGCGVLVLNVASPSELQAREKIGSYGGSRWRRK